MTSLSEASWRHATSLCERVLLIPVGATEQHGPHLPLTTDTDIACAVAAGASAALPDRIVVAPPVAFGASDEHSGFAGTLSAGVEATEAFLLALGRSAVRTWPRVLLVSTHGGNDGAVRRVVRSLRRDGHDVRAWTPAWGGDLHAGHSETSLMLAIAPETVDLDAAEPGETGTLGELMPRLATEGVRAVSANGVLGDPTGASAAEGRALLDAAIGSVTDLVAAWSAEVTA